MSFCEVIVVVRSRWFREATKFLRITGDLQYITLSEDGFSTPDMLLKNIEQNDSDNENSSAEQCWRLGEDGDIISVDAMPSHPSDIVISVKTRWRLSECWNLSIPNKPYFLTLLIQTGQQVPFLNKQLPGMLLGPNNESIIKGMLVVGPTRENVIEIIFQLEVTTLYAKANGESLLTMEIKDIENIRLISDIDPCGFVITHTGCPQHLLFNMKQQPNLLDCLLEGIESRRALLGMKPLTPYLAVDFNHIGPLPTIASRLLDGEDSDDSDDELLGEEAKQRKRQERMNRLGSKLATGSSHIKFTAVRCQVSGLPRHGSQNTIKSAALPINCDLILHNGSLHEVVYVSISSDQSPSSSPMFRNMKQVKTLSSSRLLSKLMCVILSPFNSSKMLELQYLSGYCVSYEFPTVYHCNHFIAYVLQSNHSVQHKLTAPSLKGQGLGQASSSHEIMIRASKKIFSLRTLPYHFSNFRGKDSVHAPQGSHEVADFGNETEEMDQLKEELKKIGRDSDKNNEGVTILLQRVNELHLTRFDNVAKKIAVELRRMKIASEEESVGVDINVSHVRVPQGAVEFYVANVCSHFQFSQCNDEDMPTRCFEMLMLSFINNQLNDQTVRPGIQNLSSPGGLNVVAARSDENDAAHLEAMFHLLFYKATFMNVCTIQGSTFVPWSVAAVDDDIALPSHERLQTTLDSDESSDSDDDPQQAAARKMARKKKKEERETRRKINSTKHTKIFAQFMRLLLNTSAHHHSEIVAYWSVQVLLKLCCFEYTISSPFHSFRFSSSKSTQEDKEGGEEESLAFKLNKAKESLISASGLDADTVNSGIDVIRSTLIDSKLINDGDAIKQSERLAVMKVEHKHRSILLLGKEEVKGVDKDGKTGGCFITLDVSTIQQGSLQNGDVASEIGSMLLARALRVRSLNSNGQGPSIVIAPFLHLACLCTCKKYMSLETPNTATSKLSNSIATESSIVTLGNQKANSFTLKGRDLLISELVDNDLFLNLLNTGCREAEPLMLEVMASDEDKSRFPTSSNQRKKSFRHRLQQCALEDSSFLKHFASAVGMTTKAVGTSAAVGGSDKKTFSSEDIQYSGVDLMGGQDKASKFLVAIWSKQSVDALSVLSRCLPSALVNILFEANPIPIEIALHSSLDIVKRIMFVGEVENDEQGQLFMRSEYDESNEFNDDFLGYKFSPPKDSSSPKAENDDDGSDEDDVSKKHKSGQVKLLKLMVKVKFLSHWLGDSLSFRRWIFLFDLIRNGDIDSPHLIWNSSFRSLLYSRMFAELKSLNLCRMASKSHAPLSRKGGEEEHADGRDVYLAWNHKKFEICYRPCLQGFSSNSDQGLDSRHNARRVDGIYDAPKVMICGLYIHLLLPLSSPELVSTLTSQALTCALPINSNSLRLLAPKVFQSTKKSIYSVPETFLKTMSKAEEYLKLFQFINAMKKELLMLALMDTTVPSQKLILEVSFKIIQVFKSTRFDVPSCTNTLTQTTSPSGLIQDIKVLYATIFSFPQMMLWCFKLLDTTEERDIFNKSLKLIRLLVELHHDNVSAALSYERSGVLSTSGSDGDNKPQTNSEDSSNIADEMNSSIDALVTIASLIHRRENDSDQLDKFMIFQHQSKASKNKANYMIANGEKQKDLLLRNDASKVIPSKVTKDKTDSTNDDSKKEENKEEEVGYWCYLDNNQKSQGPISVKKLRTLLAQGAVHANSLVCGSLQSPSSGHPETKEDTMVNEQVVFSRYKPLSSIRQLRWSLLLKGNSTILVNSEELCLVCVEILTIIAGGTVVGSIDTVTNECTRSGGVHIEEDEESSADEHDAEKDMTKGSVRSVSWPPSQGLLAVAKSVQFLSQLLLVIGRPKVIDTAANLLTHLAGNLTYGSLDSIIDIQKNNEIETSWRFAGPHLYLSGVYLFALSYRGSNLKYLSKFLETTHIAQMTKQPPPPCSTSFNHSSNTASNTGGTDNSGGGAESYEHAVHRSVLRPLLPDALIHYILRHGSNAFSELFLSTSNTPEAKWTDEMRNQLADTIDAHLVESMISYRKHQGNFGLSSEGTNQSDGKGSASSAAADEVEGSGGGLRQLLAENVLFRYDYVPCPPLRYYELDNELYCHGYYLKSLCAAVPAWPIREPLLLLISLLESLVIHIHNFHSKPPISNIDALHTLGLENEKDMIQDSMSAATQDENEPTKNAKFLRKLRQAYHEKARQWHPDRNPSPEAKVKFTHIHHAYELLLSMATSSASSPTLSVDSKADTHNISSSNELVLILKTHILLFNQHGEMLSNYKYPNYSLLLNLMTYSTGSGGSDSGSSHESGFANHPLSWLTLISNVLLVTTNGGIDVSNNNIDSRLFNGGNAAALIESNGASLVADLFHYALMKLDKISSSSAITLSSSSNKRNAGNSFSEQDEKDQLLHLIHILLSIICGPFASNLNFRNFLEEGVSAESGNSFDINDEKNKGKRLICDLCFCLLKEQKPFFGTLILKGILSLLGTSYFVSENSKNAVNTSQSPTKSKSNSGSVILATRLLNVNGFFKKLLLMVLQYDSSLPLPRRRAAAKDTVGLPSESNEKKLPSSAVEESTSSSQMSSSVGPLQLEKNTQALFALRLIRRLGCASYQVNDCVDRIDFYRQVRLAIQSLFPGDMSYILLALNRSMDTINVKLETNQLLKPSNGDENIGSRQVNKVNKSLDMCQIKGVSILGVNGVGALDMEITTAYHQSAARRAAQASSSSVSGSTAVGSSVTIGGNGGSMMNGMECITGEEENALCLLNMPSSTPSLIWSGDVQSSLVVDFCGYVPSNTSIKEEGGVEDNISESLLSGFHTSIHDISLESILSQDVDQLQCGNDGDSLSEIGMGGNIPEVLKHAIAFRYPQLSKEICCCGIFLECFISQNGEVQSAVSSSNSNDIDCEISRLNCALKVVGDPSTRVLHYNWINILFTLLQLSISSRLVATTKDEDSLQQDDVEVMFNVSKTLLKSINTLLTAKPKQASSPCFQDARKLSVLFDLFFTLCPECSSRCSPPPSTSSVDVLQKNNLSNVEAENLKLLGLLSVRILLKLFQESQVGNHLLVLHSHFKRIFDILKSTSVAASSEDNGRETTSVVESANVSVYLGVDLNTRFMIILSLFEALFKSSLLCCEVLLDQGVIVDLLSIAIDKEVNINIRTKTIEVIGSLVLCNQGQYVVDALSILLPVHFVDLITSSAQTSSVSNSTNLVCHYLDREIYCGDEGTEQNVLITDAPASTTSPAYLYINMFDTDHSNPELVWNSLEREQLGRHIREFMKNRFLAINAATWIHLELSISSALSHHEDLQSYLMMNNAENEIWLKGDASTPETVPTVHFWALMEKVSQRSNFGFSYINLSASHSGFSPRSHSNVHESSQNKLKIGGIYIDLFLAEPTYELKHALRFYQSLLQCLLQQGVYAPPKADSKPVVKVNSPKGAIDTDGDTSDDGGYSQMNYNKINKVVANVGRQVSKAIAALLLHSSAKERLVMTSYSSSTTILLFVDILLMAQFYEELLKTEEESTHVLPSKDNNAANEDENVGDRVKQRYVKRRQLYHECRSDDLVKILLILSKSVAFAHTCCFDMNYRKPTGSVLPSSSLLASSNRVKTISFQRQGIVSGLCFGCIPVGHYTTILESITRSEEESNIGIATCHTEVHSSAYAKVIGSLGRSWGAVAVRLHTLRCLFTSCLQSHTAMQSSSQGAASSKKRNNISDLVMQVYTSGLVHILITIIDMENNTEISSLLISSINNNVKQITSDQEKDATLVAAAAAVPEINTSSGQHMDPESSEDETDGNTNNSAEDQARRSAIVHSLAILHMVNDSLSNDFKALTSMQQGSSSLGDISEEKYKELIVDDISKLLGSSEGWEKSKNQHHDLMMVNNSVAYLTN